LESVELFHCALNGNREKTFKLYQWLLPLLRMDVPPNFVQLIKLVQAEVRMGNARVRPPRLDLVGKELEQVRKTIKDSLANRPQLDSVAAVPVVN
jgi:4-hydroxy-tetrahydrodipicolinate synthase